jgi:hypothetical protein
LPISTTRVTPENGAITTGVEQIKVLDKHHELQSAVDVILDDGGYGN